MLFELQQFVSSIVYSQPRPPNVSWSLDYQKVGSHGQILDMTCFRNGIQSAITDTWALIDSLTGGTRFANKLPEAFIDDLPNHTRDYSFMSHGPFTQEPHAFLAYIVNESPWEVASEDANGRISWNIPAINEILGIFAKINQLLSFLAFILPIMANRITQFVDTKLTNGDRLRNIHMLLTDMFNLMRYHKMVNLTGLDTCIPAFYPPCLIALMLEYVAGGLRDVEHLFTHIAYGPMAAAHHKA
jgi:hypothetical protein